MYSTVAVTRPLLSNHRHSNRFILQVLQCPIFTFQCFNSTAIQNCTYKILVLKDCKSNYVLLFNLEHLFHKCSLVLHSIYHNSKREKNISLSKVKDYFKCSKTNSSSNIWLQTNFECKYGSLITCNRLTLICVLFTELLIKERNLYIVKWTRSIYRRIFCDVFHSSVRNV